MISDMELATRVAGFDGGAAGGTDREDEEAFLTRVALGF